MRLRLRLSRAIATGSVLGLGVGATAVVGSATVASAVPISQNCTTIIGAKTFASDMVTDAPASIMSGTALTPKWTASMSVPSDLSSLMYGALKARTISGTIVLHTTVDGVATDVTLAIPETPVPATGDLPFTATGAGAPITAGAAGKNIVLGAAGAVVSMKYTNDVGTTADMPGGVIPCASGATTVSTTAVTAAPVSVDPKPENPKPQPAPVATTTTAHAAYQAKAHRITVKATVKPKASATGKVAFVLKKGKKVVRSKAVALKNGVAKLTITKVARPGKYTLTATYRGATGVKGSSDKVTVRVPKR